MREGKKEERDRERQERDRRETERDREMAKEGKRNDAEASESASIQRNAFPKKVPSLI